jgi:hypothetical protein
MPSAITNHSAFLTLDVAQIRFPGLYCCGASSPAYSKHELVSMRANRSEKLVEDMLIKVPFFIVLGKQLCGEDGIKLGTRRQKQGAMRFSCPK